MKEIEPQNNAEKELLRELFSAFSNYKLVFVVVFLSTVFSAYTLTQLRTELYESDANLLVKLGRENIEVPVTVQKGSVTSSGVRKEELNSEIQMLSSPDLIEGVVDKIGLEAFTYRAPEQKTLIQKVRFTIKDLVRRARVFYTSILVAINLEKDLTEREIVILRIQDNLKVEVEKDSNVIKVSLLFPNPDLAVRVIDCLLELYLDRHILVWQDPDVKRFFDAETISRRDRLRELEDEEQRIKKKWGLISVDEQYKLLLTQVHTLSTRIEANMAKKAELKSQSQAIRARLEVIPSEISKFRVIKPSPSVQSTKERITSLRHTLAKLSTTYQPDSHQLINIREEISALENQIAVEAPTLVDATTMESTPVRLDLIKNLEEIRVLMAGLDSSTAELHSQAAAVNEYLQHLQTGERHLNSIVRERKLGEEDYLSYVRRGQDTLMAEKLDQRRISNISVLSPPTRPMKPIYPRKLLILGVSIPIGILLGGAFTLFSAYMDDFVRTPRDLDGIDGLTYLGSLQDNAYVEPLAGANRK